jgi:hypothetical protein
MHSLNHVLLARTGSAHPKGPKPRTRNPQPRRPVKPPPQRHRG